MHDKAARPDAFPRLQRQYYVWTDAKKVARNSYSNHTARIHQHRKQINRMRLYEWLDSLSLKYIDAVVLVSKAMKSNFRIIKLETNQCSCYPQRHPYQEEQFEESTHQSFNDSTTQQLILSAIQSKDLANQAFNQNNQSLLQFNNLVNQPFNQYNCPPSHLFTLSSSITAES